GLVGWTTNTSAPRTLSWIWNHTSPSLKRARWARPRGTPRDRAIDSPSPGCALPVKIRRSRLMTEIRPAPVQPWPSVRAGVRIPLFPLIPEVAGAEGFEPSVRGPKPRALPLGHAPIGGSLYAWEAPPVDAGSEPPVPPPPV